MARIDTRMLGSLLVTAWYISLRPAAVGVPQDPPADLRITTIQLPEATSGVPYHASLDATGAISPYVWSLINGSLPPGLVLQANGQINGMTSDSGLFNFIVQAIAADGYIARYGLAINVAVATRRIAVWSSTFESGTTSQWYFPVTTANGNEGGGAFASGIAASTTSQDHAHSGHWSLKMSIAAPPESGIRMFRWLESHTYKNLYYSTWFYFPRRYSVRNYWNIFQWKSRMYSTRPADPVFVLNVGNRKDGTMHLYLYNWQKRQSYTQTLKDIPVREWFNITANYTCAGDNTGHVTVWQDDTLLFDLKNVQTRYSTGDCSWSIGNYSDSIIPSPAVIYADDAEIFMKVSASDSTK